MIVKYIFLVLAGFFIQSQSYAGGVAPGSTTTNPIANPICENIMKSGNCKFTKNGALGVEMVVVCYQKGPNQPKLFSMDKANWFNTGQIACDAFVASFGGTNAIYSP